MDRSDAEFQAARNVAGEPLEIWHPRCRQLTWADGNYCIHCGGPLEGKST